MEYAWWRICAAWRADDTATKLHTGSFAAWYETDTDMYYTVTAEEGNQHTSKTRLSIMNVSKRSSNEARLFISVENDLHELTTSLAWFKCARAIYYVGTLFIQVNPVTLNFRNQPWQHFGSCASMPIDCPTGMAWFSDSGGCSTMWN